MLFRSQLEYGDTVWGHRINKGKNRDKVESVQRQALLKVLNAPPSTPTDDMEVELKVNPVGLRLIELQRKESYKILHKEQDDPTILLVENSLSPPNSRVSPGYHLQRLSKTTYNFLQSRYYGDNSPEEIAKPLKHYERPNILCRNLGEN